jgi:hypothetical protein
VSECKCNMCEQAKINYITPIETISTSLKGNKEGVNLQLRYSRMKYLNKG